MMKYIAVALAMFLVVMALIWVSFAHAGSMSLLGVGKPATVSTTYQGPGDVVASASAWYGFRAYSTATRGNNAANICNVSDVACVDMVTDATTGALVVTTVGGSNCSVVVCTVKTLYDQTGHGFDITEATIGNRPTFTVSCVSGKPCATFVGASNQALYSSFTGPWSNQPDTVSVVVRRPTSGSNSAIVGDDVSLELAFDTAADTVKMYAGAIGASATALDSSTHAIQAVFNSASSDLNIDGTAHTVNPGAGNPGFRFMLGTDSFGAWMTGTIAEAGVWNSAFSGANSTAMSANQHSYWGF